MQTGRIYHRLVVISIWMLCLFNVRAQSPVEDFMKKVKAVNTSPVIAYDYVVYLKNTTSGIKEDSVNGRFFKVNNNYLDSNTSTICAVTKSHYCKMEMDSKTATIFDIGEFRKKYHLSANAMKPALIDISDTIIARYGKAEIQELPDGNYMVNVKFYKYDFPAFSLLLDGRNMIVRHIKFEIIEKDKFGTATGYSKIYQMDNFRYDFDSKILSSDRFFKQEHSRIILANKYSDYHLNTLTN